MIHDREELIKFLVKDRERQIRESQKLRLYSSPLDSAYPYRLWYGGR